MRGVPLLAAVGLAAFAPHALGGAGKVKPPELKLTVTQDPDPGRVGQPVRLRIAIEPPPGVTLNRYPGITLRMDSTPGAALDRKEVFVGVRQPIEDPADFPFKTIDPLELRVTPSGGAGELALQGALKFVFCVKASGYCAPGEKRVRIPVRVAR